MFPGVKPLINREIFSTITKLFFMESSSLSCEKTTMKISGPVNKLFSKVIINLNCSGIFLIIFTSLETFLMFIYVL